MATKKEKIDNISKNLYEKLFYGKAEQGGEGLQFHTTPGHLKHITNSLAKRIYEGTTTKKQEIMNDIWQVYHSNGLMKLKIWFALLNKYKFKYKPTKDEISKNLYEKLFYGKAKQGGEGLQFHTTPGHLKHITNSLAKRIYNAPNPEKQEIMNDIWQVYHSNGLYKLKMWFALLKKYKFKYKPTKDEQWVSPENIARKIPDYNSANITEEQREEILRSFVYKLVEYKPHKAVMTVNPSPPHNVPYDGTKVGTTPWEDMFPAEHGGNVHPTPQTKPSAAAAAAMTTLRKSPVNLDSYPPRSDPIPIPGSGQQRLLTSPVQFPNPGAAAAGSFATLGFKRPSSDSLGGGRKRKPIRINPKMKGVFTRKAKKHKMSVQKYARYIIKKYKGKTKNKRQLKLLKQAVFAKTAKKWKKRKRKFSRKKRRK